MSFLSFSMASRYRCMRRCLSSMAACVCCSSVVSAATLHAVHAIGPDAERCMRATESASWSRDGRQQSGSRLHNHRQRHETTPSPTPPLQQ
jgi:hypothetical protein